MKDDTVFVPVSACFLFLVQKLNFTSTVMQSHNVK
uniref:Uncharacterized protein n=1 Tax=Anguilla anguilla TaxID=7936 RepID=A0A0E9V479_ANGAN